MILLARVWAWVRGNAAVAWAVLAAFVVAVVYWRGREDEEDASERRQSRARALAQAELDKAHAAGTAERQRILDAETDKIAAIEFDLDGAIENQPASEAEADAEARAMLERAKRRWDES